MSNAGFDQRLTVFSPEGRIHQLEYALKAVESAPITAVALAGRDAAVIAVQKDVSDKLVVKESLTSIYRISDTVSCVAIGIVGDGCNMASIARQEAMEWEYRYGSPMPVELLAQRLGELNQYHTQNARERVVVASLLLISYDGEEGPQVVKVDPAGSVVNMRCCGLGQKHKEVMTFLEKAFIERATYDNEALIKLAVRALTEPIGHKPEGADMEVICATKEAMHGRLLTSDEIADVLKSL